MCIAACLALAAPGCAHQAPQPVIDGPLLELTHYEGRPNEKPVIPGVQLETLVFFDPKLPAFRLRRLRFLLGQPGRIVFTIYPMTARGEPGPAIAQVDRRYGAELVSGAAPGDQRWVVEQLLDVPHHRGPFFVGMAAPERQADPRLWGTNTDSGAVYERELDGSIGRFRHTPVLKVELEPLSALPAAPAPRPTLKGR